MRELQAVLAVGVDGEGMGGADWWVAITGSVRGVGVDAVRETPSSAATRTLEPSRHAAPSQRRLPPRRRLFLRTQNSEQQSNRVDGRPCPLQIREKIENSIGHISILCYYYQTHTSQ